MLHHTTREEFSNGTDPADSRTSLKSSHTSACVEAYNSDGAGQSSSFRAVSRTGSWPHPLSSKIELLCNYTTPIGIIIIQKQSSRRKLYSPPTRFSRETTPFHVGHACSVIFRTRFFSRHLVLEFNAIWNLGYSASLSIHHNISFPHLIPSHASVLDSVRTGNILAVEASFRSGQAGPTDALANGMTLLHVSGLVFSSYSTKDD